jgi:predicted PurR-regulated permease PerM
MWIGLSLLGIPLAFSLAVLAALLDFVPNIGPIIAGIPAVLFAFTQSPTTALHVLLLYVGVQTLESYFITPFIERKTVSLPPALTGTVQLVLALLVGIPGVIVAAPLTAVGMIIVQRLYVEGALGDRLDQDPLDDTGTHGPGASAPPRVTLQEEAARPPESPQQG